MRGGASGGRGVEGKGKGRGRGRPGGGRGQRRWGPNLSHVIRETLVDHVVNNGLTFREAGQSSAQPQQIYCCYSNLDISTRAQVKKKKKNFSLLSTVQYSLLYDLYQYYSIWYSVSHV